MEGTLKPPVILTPQSRQQRTGAILLGIGLLLLVIGVLQVRSNAATVGANTLLKNISPLLPFAGIVLTGQGIVLLRMRGRRMISWFMALPALTFILSVGVFPLLYSFGLSFIRWDVQVQGQEFVFLQNYQTVFATERVGNAVINSTVIALAEVALEFILGIGLALLFVDRFPGRGLFLSILILPLMLAPIIVGQTWHTLWDTRAGAVNDLLSFIAGHRVDQVWLADPKAGLVAIVITDVWQWTPFVFMITLAGFLAVNLELHEAAAIDGASPWETFWQVTLPVIRPVLVVALLFRLLDAFKMFDLVYVMTGGGPGYSTETLPFYLYQQGFSYGRYGYTAAASYLFMIVTVIIATLLIRRIGEI